MDSKKKFYEFKNITSKAADLFLYGEIVEDDVDWWTGEKDPSLVGLLSFKQELDNIGNVKNLNIYINSPGGDVFTASTMISMLQRKKDKGTTINAYVDGLSASAASFLMMVADNVNLYRNSTVMIHKPMSIAIGNANDMQKTIDALNKIEDSVMLPMYMDKALATEEEIKNLINEETWLSASDMSKYFNVNILNEEKVAVASIKSNLFKNYKNVPDYIKESLNSIEDKEIEENIDEKEHISNENAFFIEKNEEKEQEIKAKLNLIKGSLVLKNIMLKEGD